MAVKRNGHRPAPRACRKLHVLARHRFGLRTRRHENHRHFSNARSVAGAFSPALAQAPAPVAGTDYIEIPNGRPLDPADGVIVVEEYFNYICPGLQRLRAFVRPWGARLPAGVKVVHVPASFRADFVQYARAYYAAQSLNVAEKAHADVYEAIHRASHAARRRPTARRREDRGLLRQVRRRRAAVSGGDAQLLGGLEGDAARRTT